MRPTIDLTTPLVPTLGGVCEHLDDDGAGEVLGVKGKTVRDWRMTRGLPFFRLSSRVVRIRRTDLYQWMEQMREKRVRLPNSTAAVKAGR